MYKTSKTAEVYHVTINPHCRYFSDVLQRQKYPRGIWLTDNECHLDRKICYTKNAIQHYHNAHTTKLSGSGSNQHVSVPQHKPPRSVAVVRIPTCPYLSTYHLAQWQWFESPRVHIYLTVRSVLPWASRYSPKPILVLNW